MAKDYISTTLDSMREKQDSKETFKFSNMFGKNNKTKPFTIRVIDAFKYLGDFSAEQQLETFNDINKLGGKIECLEKRIIELTDEKEDMERVVNQVNRENKAFREMAMTGQKTQNAVIEMGQVKIHVETPYVTNNKDQI